jgi:hypothetical protein
MTIQVTQKFFIAPTQRIHNLIALINSCEAQNQMWQCGRKRRNEFIKKANSYLAKLIQRQTRDMKFKKYVIHFRGSKSLNDVAEKRRQKFEIELFK